MAEPRAKPDRGEFRFGPCLGIRHSREFERGHDVFERGHGREQVKCLQHHPDPPPPGERQRVLAHRGKVFARNLQAAAAGAFEAREHRHQAALARTRWPEQRERLAVRHGQVDPAQDLDCAVSLAETEGKIMGRNRGQGACHVAEMP